MQTGLLNLLGETKQKILSDIRVSPRTLGHLADKLKINRTAVEGHLDTLQREGIVDHYFEKAGLGRPKKFYRLTDVGYETFPRKYGSMLSSLLDQLIKLNGPENTKKVLSSVANQLARQIPSVSGIIDIKERIRALVKILNDLGFEASFEQEKGSFVITRKNCIWHEVACKYPDLTCETLDKKFLKICLGGIDVELRDCIARGNSVCKNLVSINIKPVRKRNIS